MSKDPLTKAIAYLNDALIFAGHMTERLERADRELAAAGYDQSSAPIVNVRAEAQDTERHLRALLLRVEDRQATRMAIQITTAIREARKGPEEAST